MKNWKNQASFIKNPLRTKTHTIYPDSIHPQHDTESNCRGNVEGLKIIYIHHSESDPESDNTISPDIKNRKSETRHYKSQTKNQKSGITEPFIRIFYTLILSVLCISLFAQDWQQIARDQLPPVYLPEYNFGYSVSVYEDYALIGVRTIEHENLGAAYIFKKEGDTWIRVARLTASDGEVA